MFINHIVQYTTTTTNLINKLPQLKRLFFVEPNPQLFLDSNQAIYLNPSLATY